MENILLRWEISLEKAKKSKNLATIMIFLKYPNTDGFLNISPANRIVKMRETFQNQYRLLKKDFKLKNAKITFGTRTEPRTVSAQIPLKDVFSIAEKAYVKGLDIEAIEGVRMKVIKEEKGLTENLYAIKARFAIIIEGQTKGLQQYEDRIVLIKAMNEEEAEGKAIKLLPLDEEPYLNSDKRFVWFKFEEVIDVCDCFAFETTDCIVEGLEIYSERYSRKIKPENTWVPPYKNED